MFHKQFGEFLVEEGFVSQLQLDRALYRQSLQRKRRIGEILLDMGCVTAEALARAVADQLESLSHLDEGTHSLPFGRFLVDEGVINDTQLHAALWRQERLRAQRIGEVLVQMRVLTADALEQAVRLQLDAIAAA
jgi:hypothetical protein